MMFKNKNNTYKPKHSISNRSNKHYRYIFMFMLVCICSFSIFSLRSFAADDDSEYYSHISQDELTDIFSLNIKKIPQPWQWISDAQTFVVVEDKDGDYTYWWNTPNIQMSFQNSLYSILSMSGYGNGVGENPQDSKWLVSLPEKSEAKTAQQAYGFHIQNPSYVGERPLITINIMDVLLPDGFFDGVGRLATTIFTGNILSAPTSDDMNTLLYAAPRDYETTGRTFENWVDKHWAEAMENLKDKPGQILLSTADSSTGKDSNGVVWVKETIIDDYGLDEMTDAKKICKELQEICGSNYPDVAKNILLASGIESSHNTERIMPYDLTRMNDTDKQMFNGISDPRSSIQESLLSTGYDNILWGMFKSSILTISGNLSEMAVALNSFTNFKFIENIGFKPIEFWSNSIIQILVLIMMSAFLFFCIKSVIFVIKGHKSMFHTVTKIIAIFFVCLAVYGIGHNPDGSYNLIKTVSTTVFNFGSNLMSQDDHLKALYGTGDNAEKEDCQLWLPYFNTWTSYHTNHTLLDSAQVINTSEDSSELEQPEVKNLVVPTIDNVEQNLWSTVLADSFTTKSNYSNSIYRAVDHFMAPRITNTELIEENKSLNISVKTNENYTGNIQSNIDFGSIPFQIVLVLLVLMKVLLFFEFLLNVALLLVNITLAVTDKFKLSLVVKELGASMLNVMFVNLAISLVVWASLISSGFISVILCIFFVFIFFSIIKMLCNSNTVFTPKFFRPARKMFYKTADMFKAH